ncbi:MAG: carbohydrate deacetylase [Candidatus Binatia bacterium]
MNGKLIITADDYGLCDVVNQAIEECLEAGAVRATCAMANMPAFDPTARLRQRYPQSSLGIHWTLTEGRPVLCPQQIPTLVRSDGSFYSPLQLRRLWLRHRIAAKDVEVELQAQYERFCEVAGEPEFWNTHQNFHVWPGLFRICLSLGRRLQIPKMRCHRRFTVPRDRTARSYHLSHPFSWLKGEVISRWASCARREGMLMPDGIIHMPGYETDPTSIEEVVRRLPWTTVGAALELLIHPATSSDEMLFHRHAERRVLEYRMFKDPRLNDRLRLLGIETVSFHSCK